MKRPEYLSLCAGIVSCISCVLWSALPAAAQERGPYPYGICSHLLGTEFAGRDKAFAMMRTAGIGAVRCDFTWRGVEPKPGKWDFSRTDAIVASAAMQVPALYKLVSYVINNGNIIRASAQITLSVGEEKKQGVMLGDGPIDAAFLCLEQIIGKHYELDDFEIQSVTEGKEAMGSALVKLRKDGKVYSGKGISTDIIGASIRAYLSAVNKIAYEEE